MQQLDVENVMAIGVVLKDTLTSYMKRLKTSDGCRMGAIMMVVTCVEMIHDVEGPESVQTLLELLGKMNELDDYDVAHVH